MRERESIKCESQNAEEKKKKKNQVHQSREREREYTLNMKDETLRRKEKMSNNPLSSLSFNIKRGRGGGERESIYKMRKGGGGREREYIYKMRKSKH